MRTNPQELAFALRSPISGPLAAVICALADLFEDPSFNEGHRALLQGLLERGEIPQSLADNAMARLTSFASSLESLHTQVFADNGQARASFDLPSEAAPRLRCVV